MKVKREYYTLADAAQQLECTADDLIHLSANLKFPALALANGWIVRVYGFKNGCEPEYLGEECFIGPVILYHRDKNNQDIARSTPYTASNLSLLKATWIC